MYACWIFTVSNDFSKNYTCSCWQDSVIVLVHHKRSVRWEVIFAYVRATLEQTHMMILRKVCWRLLWWEQMSWKVSLDTKFDANLRCAEWNTHRHYIQKKLHSYDAYMMRCRRLALNDINISTNLQHIFRYRAVLETFSAGTIALPLAIRFRHCLTFWNMTLCAPSSSCGRVF